MFFAFAIFIHAIPQFASGKSGIDEMMPATIPGEIIADWKAKDKIDNSYSAAIEKIIDDVPQLYKCRINQGDDETAYINACHVRRIARIMPYSEKLQKILYALHHDIGGAIIGFTEELENDTFVSGLGKWGAYPSISRGKDYSPGGALLTLEMKNVYPTPLVLLEDKTGCIRDPCVSFDGKKVIFAWSKENKGYHLYEMELDNPTKAPAQLTDDPPGLIVSDFEPCYLPNGDIVFNSSRCFGYVDCNFNITSNLYIMNKAGKYLRRIGYDQLHTCYPTMKSDGTVLYSRWEYNDRNIATCFGVFQMYIDGSHQTEYFGNQTTWPATVSQAREVPASGGKILGITGGHMGPYAGDLVLINPSIARNGSNVVQLIAPKRTNPVTFEVLKGVPDSAKLFQNPYPLDEKWFLISYRTDMSSKFRIYLMNVDGDRELLAWDVQSVSQQQSLCPQLPPQPPITAYQADYSKATGEVSMIDAYTGSGTGKSVAKGSIKKIRVIALEYHTDPSFGSTGSAGYTMTPVARWLGSWMAKRIIGEAKVESDGSACFTAPARTPIYFQLIDSNGCAINSMRSWMTLQPGERFDCYGCHEDKNATPQKGDQPLAAKPQELDSFFGIRNDYLYYPKHLQPIWDAKCVRCHKPGKTAGAKLDLSGTKIWTGDLKDDANNVNAGRFWCKSYYNLTLPQYVNFIDVNSPAEGLPPNSVGSIRSGLITTLNSPPSGMNFSLTKAEMGKICAWIDLCIPHSGFYTDDMRHDDSLQYLNRLKRRELAQQVEEKNIAEFIAIGGYKSYANGVFFHKNDATVGFKSLPNSFIVRVSSSGQRLFVRVPGKGKMALLDMLGRTVVVFTFDNEANSNVSSIPVRAKLPRGIYIASFKGIAVTEQRIVNVQ
jgi:hypothetical protein